MLGDLDEIEGWLSRNEGMLLYDLACRSPGLIVEIGAWKGKSTSYLMIAASQNSKKLVTIDHFRGSIEHQDDGPIDTYADFLRNVSRVKASYKINPEMTILKMASKEANDLIEAPIGMLFVDGSHEYEDVKLDYNLWYPKLCRCGIIAFHDSYRPGPQRVISEAGKTGHNCPLQVCDSISWWFKYGDIQQI